MRAFVARHLAMLTVALTLALLLTALPVGSTQAQEVVTPTVEEPTPTPPQGDTPPETTPDPAAAEPTVGPHAEGEQATDDAAQVEEAAPAEELVALPEGYVPPPEAAELSNSELADLQFPNQVQGDIKLDVIVSPERIQAGQELSYTYVYTNSRSTAASFIVRARWTNFKRVGDGGVYQFCKTPTCEATAVTGPAVARDTTATSDTEIVYNVASLNPGQSGRFTVLLGTRPEQFPTTGTAPKRPAGSAQIANNKTSAVISEDTANALFVGPVFVLTKTVSSSVQRVYVGDEVEFTITIGNATSTGDIIDGRTRTDAVAATNIQFVDKFPDASEFVRADGPVAPTVDTTNKELRWTFPGPLNPGAAPITIKVVFKKLDLNAECGRLNNKTFRVTSNEMPLQTGTTRFAVSGRSAGIDVRTPLQIQSISVEPNNPIYGTEALLTIKVASYWRAPINNLEVRYYIQSNGFYSPVAADPPPVEKPTGATPGGTVKWLINMPAAANINTPAVATIRLTVRGDYNKNIAGGTGRAQIITTPAQNVPSACIATVDGRANFQPRLYFSKLPDPDATPNEQGRYVVRPGDPFTFIISVENRGVADATDVVIQDLMPGEAGANFNYVLGSATLNGTPIPDTSLEVVDGRNGTVTLRDVTIPAGDTVDFQLQLNVVGDEFIDYCNRALISSGNEEVRAVTNRVCVRLNPPFTLAKTANRLVVDGNNTADNREVEFTLSFTNQDNASYQIGLYDAAGKFELVRVVEGDAPVPATIITPNDYEWPTKTVAGGETYRVRVVMKLSPAQCSTAKYTNELLFRIKPTSGNSYLVRTVPATKVEVQFNCGRNLISFNKSVDIQTVSTRDRHVYTLNVRNENQTDAITNVEISDVLPSGFTYVGMDSGSLVKSAPTATTRTDGRIRLTWKVPSLAAKATSTVRFIARSGDIVGTFENWLTASADNLLGVLNCVPDSNTPNPSCGGYIRILDENVERIYATRSVKVEPLATLEPSIDNKDQCAQPNEGRSYQVALVNTNRHAYASTTVTTTLPLGLHFDGVAGNVPAPRILSQNDKGTVLVWQNLSVPAKPGNATSSQLVLDIKLRIGQVWGPLQPRVEANSPDGSLPKKDGVLDPTVSLCSSGPAIGLDASKRRVLPDEEFFYVLSLVNPESTAITVSVNNTLPTKLRFVANVQGDAPSSTTGGALVWNNIQVPAANNGAPGVKLIIFKVKVTGAKVGDVILNEARVGTSSTSVDGTNGDVEVVVVDAGTRVYLPFIRR